MNSLLQGLSAALAMLPLLTGCMQRSGEEGSPAIKVFSALGICLAAIFLVFYLVVKWREKD
jgi:hypothetical protein